jgi:hypothetical protein
MWAREEIDNAALVAPLGEKIGQTIRYLLTVVKRRFPPERGSPAIEVI